MSFAAFYSESFQGRTYWLVVHLKPPSALALSDTMVKRIQASTNDPNIFIDHHTTGINITMGARNALRVTVQDLTFELDYEREVKLLEDPAMRFQLKVEISNKNEWGFVVKVIVGTDEACDIRLGFLSILIRS
jgi:hypothetical protein